ncbi:MAG: hypothetical protein J5659_00415 [Clostridia bacterium]|nr:hypothetical protein [Clostridia bacterium]
MLGAFITSFCVGCIALGLLYVLVPGGNLSNAAKYAFSLTFLCIVLSSATFISKADIKLDNKHSLDFGDERLSAASARLVFSEALSAEKINFDKIVVFTDKSGADSINITKVYVYTDASEQRINEVIGSDSYEVVVVNE